MLRAGIRSILSLAALAIAIAAPAAAEETRTRAEYTVTMGGTHIASVAVILTDNGGQYALALDAKIAGLAQLVASGSARASSAGTTGPNGLVSHKFDLLTRAQGDEFTTAVTYANGRVETFKVAPPILNTIDRIPIERKDLTRATDMMAPFVLRGAALDKDLCARQMPIFTGVAAASLRARASSCCVARMAWSSSADSASSAPRERVASGSRSA